MRYYDSIAKGYEELHREEQLTKLKLILEHTSYDKASKLLDVGCGTGLSSVLFNCEKYGIDPSFGLLKQAGQRMPVVQGKAENLPFKDNSFDIIICLTALHNFDDPKKALLEMKRVCTGKLVISVLKRAKNFDELMKIVSNTFKVKELLEEPRDIILFCG